MDFDLHLSTPSEFPAFPYDPPYEIQTQLMRHLYESIEQRKVTVVESPTGTGKTLSLLCSSLTWLSDERERARKGKLKEMAGSVESEAKDWVIHQTLSRIRREMEADEREYQEKLGRARKREEVLKKAARARVGKRQRLMAAAAEDTSKDDDDSQFLPETDQGDNGEDMHISPALRSLMAKVDKGTRSHRYGQEIEELSQVLPELSKLKLNDKHILVTDHHRHQPQAPPPLKRGFGDDVSGETDYQVTTRTVSLGSRKQLCINDHLRSTAKDLDEACRELLGEKDKKRCPYLPPPDDEERMLDFRDQILATPKDIEDLASAGRLSDTCPYFGARRAIPQAELITLPYNLLLQKSAREALGINLKDQIVLIDEAHNLIPTLLSLSTVRLTYHTLLQSFQQVCTYVSRFKARLSPVNMLHLKRLVVFLDGLRAYVVQWKETKMQDKDKVEIMTAGELISRLGKKVAGINLMEVEAYLKRSKIARKIAGYSDKQAGRDVDEKKQARKGRIPPLHTVEIFILALMGANDDGRVTFKVVNHSEENTVEMTYHLLNPSPHFREVVEEARSVVLAGGTMSPISDIIDQLLSYLPEDKISSFSCGHIIPKENLQTLVITKGPTGAELDFKSERQRDPATISQIGQIILNFANVIPAGVIVFFPSYRFLNFSRETWMKDGSLGKFAAKKQVFFEPEDGSIVEKTLQQYGMAATKPPDGKKGALLFAVIGAKLSEGLNFSDDLARGVVIIGLPFANLASPELQERLKYVKRLEDKRRTENPKIEPGQKDAAAELYENMCMNAVNQSIGRAIRHRGDWASLLLVDRRYSTTSIKHKLPKWIGDRVVATESFGQTVKEMGLFFRSKRLC